MRPSTTSAWAAGGPQSGWRNAIEAYRAELTHNLDKPAAELLTCLADNSDAAKAFARLQLKDQQDAAAIIAACIEAERLARTFRQCVEKAERILARKVRLDNSVSNLRKFVEGVAAEQAKPSDQLWLRMLEAPADIAAMGLGLALIKKRIEMDEHVAKQNLFRLGATRKTKTRKAAQKAAILWVGDAVRRITGRPHHQVVADLAQVVLGSKAEVSVDHVRAALRARGQWRWVAPI